MPTRRAALLSEIDYHARTMLEWIIVDTSSIHGKAASIRELVAKLRESLEEESENGVCEHLSSVKVHTIVGTTPPTSRWRCRAYRCNVEWDDED